MSRLLKCIGGKKPKLVVSDKEQRMAQAISKIYEKQFTYYVPFIFNKHYIEDSVMTIPFLGTFQTSYGEGWTLMNLK